MKLFNENGKKNKKFKDLQKEIIEEKELNESSLDDTKIFYTLEEEIQTKLESEEEKKR